MRILDKVYENRFPLFLASQSAILFGSLIVPAGIYELISPSIFFINIIAGSLFLGSEEKAHVWIIILVLIIIGGVFAISAFDQNHPLVYLKIAVLFMFHAAVTVKMIQQVWQAKLVNRNMFFGLISGFISLGLVGFFLCLSIETVHDNSFSGLVVPDGSSNSATEKLMYFSYVTLLTIGYGDILPLTNLAQKATILIGLVGQFYLVIITAIVVGKFINQTEKKDSED